jgi:hypothetical protein
MKAEEAVRLSESNKMDLNGLYEIIKQNASEGFRQYFCPIHISKEDILTLMMDGYKISYGYNQRSDEEGYLIQW